MPHTSVPEVFFKCWWISCRVQLFDAVVGRLYVFFILSEFIFVWVRFCAKV